MIAGYFAAYLLVCYTYDKIKVKSFLIYSYREILFYEGLIHNNFSIKQVDNTVILLKDSYT